MVKIKDILDRETLKAWLEQIREVRGEEEGRRIANYIAHRTSMRVLPIYWGWVQAQEPERIGRATPLPVLQASLVSMVAPALPRSDTKTIVNAAIAAALAPAMHNALDAAGFAADTIADVHDYQAATAAAECARASAYSLEQECAGFDLWTEIRSDAAASLESVTKPPALWLDDNPLAEVWDEVKSTSMAVPEGHARWSFWRRWYRCSERRAAAQSRNAESHRSDRS